MLQYAVLLPVFDATTAATAAKALKKASNIFQRDMLFLFTETQSNRSQRISHNTENKITINVKDQRCLILSATTYSTNEVEMKRHRLDY